LGCGSLGTQAQRAVRPRLGNVSSSSDSGGKSAVSDDATKASGQSSQLGKCEKVPKCGEKEKSL